MTTTSHDLYAPATAMLAALRERQISAVELLDRHLQRIARHNPALNAIVEPDYERARASAAAADAARARGEDRSLLGLRGKRVSPGRHYFDCGGVILACYDPRADGDAFQARPNPDHVYFAVRDLESVFCRARKLACQELEPGIQRRPWGERSFYARDPFGNPICFVDEASCFMG